MSRRVVSTLTLLLVVSMLVAACGRRATPSPTAVPPTDTPVAATATTAPPTTAPTTAATTAATTAPTTAATTAATATGAATSAATIEPTAEITTTATAEPTGTVQTGETGAFKVGQVTDTGGIDDRSFNQTAWKGIEDAMRDFGITGSYLESEQLTDYAANIGELLAQDYDLIITVGYLLGTATAVAAKENPEVNFAIVDYAYPDCAPGAVEGRDCGSATEIDNVLGLTFATDQAAFLAGYLAAAVSETGIVGTFGGIKIPTVTIFMVGMEHGIAYYNEQHGTNVQLLGWQSDPTKDGGGDGLFTGNFDSTDDGRRFAEQLMDENADIIMPVAGPVGYGSAAAVQERGAMMIGVDSDWFVLAPEYQDIYLTSVLKNMDAAVYDTVEALINGDFAGGVYVGTLENGGVGLAPYHNFEDAVSEELQAELEQVRQGLIDGTIETGWPVE